ncbi:MAG: DUF3352 domain-containing protein [Bacteroidota bacterium]|nr:DUF3352 domain-containing protein [Bacteroidota bacterium]
MAVKKKKIIVIVFIILVVLAIVGLWSFNKFIKPQYLSSLNALPENTMLYYKGKDFSGEYKRFSKTKVFQHLIKIKKVKKINSQVILIDSLINSNDKIKNLFQSNEIILSVNKISVTNADILLLFQTKGELSPSDVQKLIKKKKGCKLVERTFRNKIIYDYQLTKQNSQLAFALLDGILILSRSPILVEDAIRTFEKNTGNLQTPAYHDIYQEMNESWFFDFEKLNSFFELFVSPSVINEISKLKNFASTGNYSIQFSDAKISLRGNVSVKDSLFQYAGLFEGQKPRNTEITKILSRKTSVLFSYNLSDFSQWYSNYSKHQTKLSDRSKYENSLFKFENEHSISIEKEIVPLLYGSFALAINEPISKDIYSSTIILFKVFEIDKSIRKFTDPAKNFSYSDSSQSVSKISYRGFDIYKTNLSASFKFLFGSLFDFPEETYFTSIRDYLLFCPDLSNIKRAVDDYLAQRILKTSISYNRFSDQLTSKSNFLLYVNPSRSLMVPERFLNKTKADEYIKNKGVFSKFGAFAFQLTNNFNNSFYNEIVINYTPELKNFQEYLWEIELDAPIFSKPFVVKNHNDGSNEIVVFDKQNKMYLISASGKILWKKQLEDSIIGNVFQLDLYNNRKLQYLFTTEKKLQLIDRLGRDVANYPIKLSSNATSGLAVFDIRKNNKHKYFVGSSNNYIFGYNESGKPLNGWRPNKISGNLDFPLKYFVKTGKTCLVGVSDKGVFYLWDLNGDKVFDPLKLDTKFTNPFQIQFERDFDKTHLISTDTSGMTYFLYLSGKAEIKKYGNWTGKVYFNYLDINNNGDKELIFAEGNSILGYTHEGKVVFSTILDAEITSKPKFVKIGEEYFIAYLNKEYGKVFLVDFDGTLNQGFPINCNSPFEFSDIDEDGKLEIIGGNDNKLFLSRF